MASLYDIFRMLAGIAFFLLAFDFMESSLRSLAGRKFKLFLKKQTSGRLRAIAGGTVVSGVLQSSSIVNLLLLSMVGAGVLGMEHVLAVMLGSNLGTSLSNWMIAAFGFGYDIEKIVLPVVAVSGISMAFSRAGSRGFFWFKFLFGFAFLFVSLGFIKSGMEGFVLGTDLSAFSAYPAIIYLLVGISLTALVQSSTATVALTLSAMDTGLISLFQASAIVLGAEIGTTFKLFIASAGGGNDKKRVALGNFIINVATVLIFFLLLKPINHFVSNGLGVHHSIFALVLIQSLINLSSIILFYPFLKPFSRLLMQTYTGNTEKSFFINKVTLKDPELALEALEQETKQFFGHVIEFTLDAFKSSQTHPDPPGMRKDFISRTVSGKYDYVKQMYGEMHGFSLRLQQAISQGAEAGRLHQLIAAARNGMYAAKNIHDAIPDIEQLSNSSHEIKYAFYVKACGKMIDYCSRVSDLLERNGQGDLFKELVHLYESITGGYSSELHGLYKQHQAVQVNELDISTLINFNRQLYTSFKSYVFGLKDFLLSAEEAEQFDAMPGFIR